ncbi:MAG: NAD(P)-dependent oxidoreductase [Armatimonadota bacterium]|jgi:nucleoside-diphosphate-sugar epimerase
MTVLVTGAAGVLGRALVPLLETETDADLRLTDVLDLDTPHEFVKADLADREATAHLCGGVDQVLHLAAIHPWRKYTPREYIECNITGTYNVLQAAAGAGVKRVIYTSSIAAMGYGADSPEQLPFDESKPCRPTEGIYGITKHVGEQFCEMFRATHDLPYVALRPGTFIPMAEQDPAFGLGLLSVRVHASDVAMAHVLALKSDLANEAIIVTAGVPFSSSDGPDLLADAAPVILNYFPDAAALRERGIELPRTIDKCYNVAKARRLLGYEPEWTFEKWLAMTLSE